MTQIVKRLSSIPRLLAVGFGIAILAVAAMAPAVSAATAPATSMTPAAGGQAFSISPPLLELKADPGQSVTAHLTITNISTTTLQISAEANDFGAKDEEGDPNILFNDSNSAPYALRTWVKLPGEFTLKSKESKTVDFPIAVPKNAEPGGHYGVLRFTGAAAGAGSSNVSLSASIGTLVLLQVSGNITESASVVELYSATQKNNTKSSFFQTGPVNFVTRIKDTGNTHIKPTGTLDVANIFGKKVATLTFNGDPNDAKNPPKIILPASIRRFENTLNKKWLFGRYTATLHTTYGDKNTALTAKTTFWVIPYKIVAVIVVGLILLFLLLRLIIKRYNRHIINKAQGGGPQQNPPTTTPPSPSVGAPNDASSSTNASTSSTPQPEDATVSTTPAPLASTPEGNTQEPIPSAPPVAPQPPQQTPSPIFTSRRPIQPVRRQITIQPSSSAQPAASDKDNDDMPPTAPSVPQ